MAVKKHVSFCCPGEVLGPRHHVGSGAFISSAPQQNGLAPIGVELSQDESDIERVEA
jgi:hypothetical protein